MDTHNIKTMLPNGKRNPEYTKWYRTTETWKEAMKRYRKSAAHAQAMKKYRSSEKGKQTAKKNRPIFGTKICAGCKIKYLTEDVLARGYKILGRFHCLCDMCK